MMDELKESITLLLKRTEKLDDIQKHMISIDKTISQIREEFSRELNDVKKRVREL